MYNGAAVLEHSLAVPQNVKHRIAVWSRNSTPRYKPKKNEDILSKKLVHEYL